MIDIDVFAGRAGRLDCLCPPEAGQAREGLLRLSLGFGLSVLSQALVLAALPLAAGFAAPSPTLAGVPYALLLFGAMLATFPAAFLLDSFGRRGAFALGAGLGIAGGALAYWASLHRAFPMLCLAAFWIGLSSGFALFYRHAAAAGASGPRGGAIVFGGGALAALLAPSILSWSATAGPLADSYVLGLSGLVNVAALSVAIVLPHALPRAAIMDAPPSAAPASILAPTIIGAISWFFMSLLMASLAGDLVGCGAPAADIGGIVSWHLLAMYAPGALVRLRARTPSTWALLAPGLIILGAGVVLFFLSTTPWMYGAAMILVGAGWSVANAGLIQMLHDGPPPQRSALALHDFALLAAAMAGALLAPLLRV